MSAGVYCKWGRGGCLQHRRGKSLKHAGVRTVFVIRTDGRIESNRIVGIHNQHVDEQIGLKVNERK